MLWYEFVIPLVMEDYLNELVCPSVLVEHILLDDNDDDFDENKEYAPYQHKKSTSCQCKH